MNQPVRFYLLLICALMATTALYAQNAISTQPLGTASLCPGSSISVPFTRTGTFSTSSTFTVQLSDGGDYRNLETGGLSYNSNTGLYSVIATIPGTQAAGTTYTLRVIAINPAVVGTPSTTRLTIKSKPAPPTGNSPQYDCQYRQASANASVYLPFTTIYLTGLTPRSTVTFYDSNNSRIEFTKGDYNDENSTSRSFKSPAYYINGTPGTKNLTVTQTVDGCESEKMPLQVITKSQPDSGPRFTLTETVQVYPQRAAFPVSMAFAGRLVLCQGSVASSLNSYLETPPAGFAAVFVNDATGESLKAPYVPSTSTAGRVLYQLLYAPIDPNAGCSNHAIRNTYIAVDIIAPPAKPAVSASTIALCQYQQATALTAGTSASGASLVWYGTNATGGTGSGSANVPSTTTPGTYKYYVAQKINDCEGERAEITVEVRSAAAAPAVSSVAYCQGAQVRQLSATPASGGTLNWYTSLSGGSSSSIAPTPSTTNPGTTTYYVSQTISGSCESQRVALPVTVYGAPSAPTISRRPTYTFCQFAQGESLSAEGQNLRWYETESGGTGTSTLTPGTSVAGSKVYYVSQTINGCESSRASITHTVLEAPAAPTITQASYEFCQGATATISGNITPGVSTNWYIYGDAPGFNSTYTSGSTAFAYVSTSQARSMTYSLFQTGANGCKGPASSLINVTVKPTPATPTVQAVSVCQSTTAPTLQATGTNLRWYTAVSGGAGSDVTPVVSTSQAGQTTYYVSQALNGCESPRAPLSVTVNAIPGVPVVSTAGPAYCQGAGAVALVAIGQGLNWYKESAGGTSLGSSVTPETGTPGNTTYYVSQRINGCEGGRSSLTVSVKSLPATPTVTSAYTYCQKTAPASLTATGTGLVWYGGDGKRSDTAPTPSTETPGTVSYYVTQTAEGCESQRAEIKVTTNATPDAPVVQAVAICQGQTAPTLQAVGQSLLWYTAESGGTGAATAPAVNTGQAGQTTFYVSQSKNGCEGPRASLAATVKALPPAPGVTQRNICQFAPAEPVTATGTSLIWYNADNNRFNSTPSVLTDKGATFTYLVTQTIDGCEGPKATLTVNVLTTPVPTVTKTTVEICQGATAQPLEATGTNLRWTDPSGVTSTTAPVPSAVVATARPDGDVYYVTQTGTNTCESPRVAVRVFVQTVPTLTVSGTTTINLGQETPIKLTFTGVGPYQYRLSAGLLGTATKDTTILVLPERTTTYQVVDVTNKCGVGQAGSLASITVRVPTIQTLAMSSTTLCVGTNLTAAFQTTGDFNTGSVFKLQLAKTGTDTTKAAFTDLLNSTVANGQLTAAIPTTLGAGTYWVRIMATNPKIPINGSISPTLLTIRPLPTAALTGTQSIYEGQSAKLSVAFTGDAPWTFSLQDSSATGSGAVKSVQTAANPHTIDVSPTQSTAYVLRDVQNGCGLTKLTLTPVLVTVNKVLGVEDQALADALEVYPVPAVTTLTVKLRGLSPAQTAHIELISETGMAAWQTETRQETSVLSLDRQPAGVYVLRVRVGDRTASRRIVKR